MRPQLNPAIAEVAGRGTSLSFPAGVPGLIREVSRMRPTAVAVECGTERLTYAQLEAWSDELGRTLRAEAPSGLAVAVAVPRGVQLPVVLLGAHSPGCTSSNNSASATSDAPTSAKVSPNLPAPSSVSDGFGRHSETIS